MAKNPLEALVKAWNPGRQVEAAPETPREFSHVVYMRDAKSKKYLLVNRNGIKQAADHTLYVGPILSTMQIGTYIAPDEGNAWKIRTIINYLPLSKRSGRAVTIFWLEEALSYHPTPT